MSGPERGHAEQRDPRVYLAAERTLLAWIRTGLSLMGFGFVLARFGLFLSELASHEAVQPSRHVGASQWIGMILVILGVLANVTAATRHVALVRRYDRGERIRFSPVSASVLLSGLLGILGLLLVGYLLRLA